GTASGYSGALDQVGSLSSTSPVAGAGRTALAAHDYYIFLTANAGISGSGFGESIVSSQDTETVASGDVLSITWAAVV
ncbi:hypothetical protein, partial [Klebsiella aerogenes]|uniref:hypothetical protein n=1 Tax=Klebsiella aerogenes TaxID=548 RepID=UPI001CC34865